MKRILSILIATLLIFGLVGCNNPFQKKKEAKVEEEKKEITAIKADGSMKGVTLKVGVSPDFAPFTVRNPETKEMEGFDIDILEALSQELGFEYVLVVGQMREIEEQLKAGKIDCAITGISITDARQEDFWFTDTYFKNTLSLIINENVVVESRKDIVHMTLGAELGTTSYSYMTQYMSKKNNKIRGYKNISAVYRALERGKIQAAIVDTTAAEYYLEKNPESKIQILENKLYDEQSDYGIMCPKKFKYIDEFNVGLKNLDLNGTYQTIYNTWFEEEE